jgi:hypothetical protein
MAQVYRLYPDTYSTETLALAFQDGYTTSAEIDNSTEKWQGLWAELTADLSGVLSPGERYIHVSLIGRKTDGTNSEDNGAEAFQQNLVASLKYRGTDAQQKWAFHVPSLPATKFTFWFGNFTDNTMSGTSELKIMLYTTEVASA